MAALGQANPLGDLTAMGGAATPPEFSELVMVVERETATPKRMSMGVSLTPVPGGDPIDMAIEITFTVVDYDADIPAQLFEFEIPEGIQVVEWTADRSAE